MSIKELIDKALFYLSVPKCVSCKKRLNITDNVFCPECSLEFRENIFRNCSRCARPLAECTCTNEYLRRRRIKSVIKVYRYIRRPDREPQNKLIYSLKQDGRHDVVNFSADLLSRSVKFAAPNASECVITSIPRRRSAILRFGYDHAKLLAEAVAKRVGAEYIPMLKSLSKRAQKSLHRDLRMENVKFVEKRNVDIKGRCVIIVDDVITTGASMGAAADIISRMKPKSIIAATLSIAYNDEFIPPMPTEY